MTIDWEPPARGTCGLCGRRIVYDNGYCAPCTKEESERDERERRNAEDAADEFSDEVFFSNLLERPCFFEFDGPDDPDYCLEHMGYCAP